MVYTVYFSNAGVPTTGLSLTWEYLKQVSDGSDDGSPPSFTEVGGGWYKFTYSTATDLVGVIDGSETLTNTDRYVPVYLSPTSDQIDKSIWSYGNRTLGNS